MNTKWEGLWGQERQGFYSGRIINKSDIPSYARIVLRYNKFYEKEGNKPRFIYRFADSEGYKENCIQLEYEDSLQSKIDKLAEIMRKGHDGSEWHMLPKRRRSFAPDSTSFG